MENTYLFQYATKQKIIEDTDLISFEKAKELWDKYIPDIKKRWNDFESPEMCIWKDCKNNTDYHTILIDIDFREHRLENDIFYKEEIINLTTQSNN